MCPHIGRVDHGVVGRIPDILLKGDMSGEWDSRLMRWALQPITHIAAPEHILHQNEQQILVYNRVNPNTAVFAIQVGGQSMGSVVAF
jgi:hypothetical protein